jgi:hypothetical protein
LVTSTAGDEARLGPRVPGADGFYHEREVATRLSFSSILGAAVDEGPEPEYFGDLNLDQFVTALTAGRQEYRLEPIFSARLRDPDAIAYRHEVLRDLDGEALTGTSSPLPARCRRCAATWRRRASSGTRDRGRPGFAMRSRCTAARCVRSPAASPAWTLVKGRRDAADEKARKQRQGPKRAA